MQLSEFFSRGTLAGSVDLRFDDENDLRAVNSRRDFDFSGFAGSQQGVTLLADELAPFSHVVRAGAQVVNFGLFAGTQSIPSDVDRTKRGGWGNTPPDVEPDTALANVSPKRVWAQVTVSEQLVKQGGIAGAELVNRQLFRALSVEIDRAAFSGDGANGEPVGLVEDSAVPVLAGGPAAPSMVRIAAMEAAIADAEAENRTLTLACSPDVRKHMRNASALSGGTERSLWEAAADFNRLSTPRLPAATMVLGNFSELVIAHWGAMTVLVNPYSRDIEGFVRLTVSMQADVIARVPNAFVIDSELDLS